MAPRPTTPVLFLTLIALLAWSPATPAAAAEAPILTVDGDVQKPVKIHAQAPAYPEMARKDRIQGRVVATTVINDQGKVESIEIVESLGEDFDAAVREALMGWEFEPATLHGEPVRVYYNLTVNFRLDSDKDDAKEAKGES